MSIETILSTHRASEPREEQDRLRMIEFARRHSNPFDRAIPEGHFTGSGLVMAVDGSQALLLHHLKLHRWLQPGGHGEAGETHGENVAAREVAEETGLAPRLHPEAPRPFDVDIHRIPARKQDPEHDHLDLRYLFVAHPSEPLRAEAPEDGAAVSTGLSLRWFEVSEALAMDLDPGLKRMIRKAAAILCAPPNESVLTSAGEAWPPPAGNVGAPLVGALSLCAQDERAPTRGAPTFRGSPRIAPGRRKGPGGPRFLLSRCRKSSGHGGLSTLRPPNSKRSRG